MKHTDQHPDRAEIVAALRAGDLPFADHLSQCESCRMLCTYLQAVLRSGGDSMQSPSPAAVRSWSSIPLLDKLPAHPERRTGVISFDSWTQSGAVAVRDVSVGQIRRLVLTAGEIACELVAERLQRGWECVARVYESGRVSHGFVLRLGRRRLLPATQGFYHWNAATGPKDIALVSENREITIELPAWL